MACFKVTRSVVALEKNNLYLFTKLEAWIYEMLDPAQNVKIFFFTNRKGRINWKCLGII